jgi:hypothetical protein
MEMRADFYKDKLSEVNCNIKALEKAILISRYVDFMDKNGNVSDTKFDQQIVLDELIALKKILIKEIGAMQNSSEMI